MKSVLLICLCLAFAKPVLSQVEVAELSQAQSKIDTGLPDIHVTSFDLSEKVDSVWTHEYVMEDGTPVFKTCTIQVFDEAGNLTLKAYTYFNQGEEIESKTTYIYEKEVLKEVRKGKTVNELKAIIKYEFDEKGRIASRSEYKYNYNKEAKLATVVRDEVVTEKTVFFSYGARGNLIENKTAVYGKMSGNEISNTYLLYYIDEPFASVDFVNFTATIYNGKYGTMTKDFTVDTIGAIYKDRGQYLNAYLEFQ